MPLDFSIGGGLSAKLQRLSNPDFRLTVAKWEAVMKEDNTRGVMAGKGGHDEDLPETTYRGSKLRPEKRRNRYSRGIGLPLGSPDDNLTSSEYRRLNGPPLAPRGKASRVIRNYATRSGFDGSTWFAEGAWLDVVSRKGIPFLRYHFEGRGRLPRRDLRGVRAWGRAEALKILRADVARMLKG